MLSASFLLFPHCLFFFSPSCFEEEGNMAKCRHSNTKEGPIPLPFCLLFFSLCFFFFSFFLFLLSLLRKRKRYGSLDLVFEGRHCPSPLLAFFPRRFFSFPFPSSSLAESRQHPGRHSCNSGFRVPSSLHLCCVFFSWPPTVTPSPLGCIGRGNGLFNSWKSASLFFSSPAIFFLSYPPLTVWRARSSGSKTRRIKRRPDLLLPPFLYRPFFFFHAVYRRTRECVPWPIKEFSTSSPPSLPSPPFFPSAPYAVVREDQAGYRGAGRTRGPPPPLFLLRFFFCFSALFLAARRMKADIRLMVREATLSSSPFFVLFFLDFFLSPVFFSCPALQ